MHSKVTHRVDTWLGSKTPQAVVITALASFSVECEWWVEAEGGQVVEHLSESWAGGFVVGKAVSVG